MATPAESKRKRVAPYVPASTLSAFFDHIRYVRTPTDVDSNLLQDYGVSHGHAFALLSTLKYLNVIDDKGKPLPIFRDLQTGGEEFRDALKGVVERAYDDLFSRLDVSRDTKDKIVNFFARNYSPATAERAARLFLDLCGEAGIETASQPRKADTVREKTKTQTAHKKKGQEKSQEQGQGFTQTSGGDESKGPQGMPEISTELLMPRIDIRINSQDLVNMNPEQIERLFQGLSKLTPKPTQSAGSGDENGRQQSTEDDD